MIQIAREPNGTARRAIIVSADRALSQGALHSRDRAATPDDYRLTSRGEP